jgi:2-oxoglutaroyl-CoA hydrolase
MRLSYTFIDPRLTKLNGFQVEIDEPHERADIILNRPPYNIVAMPQRVADASNGKAAPRYRLK